MIELLDVDGGKVWDGHHMVKGTWFELHDDCIEHHNREQR